MKQTLTFTKEIPFRTHVSEIVSMTLEHDIKLNDQYILSGDILVKGEYKLTKHSQIANSFSEKLPVDIAFTDEYDISDATVEIETFDYTIENHDVVKVTVNLGIYGLKEKEKEVKVEINDIHPEESAHIETEEDLLTLERKGFDDLNMNNNFDNFDDNFDNNFDQSAKKIDLKGYEEEVIPVDEVLDKNSFKESIFNSITFDDKDEEFVKYIVYVLQDGDTIDAIVEKYEITYQDLIKYNDLENIGVRDKIIIPTSYND